MKNLNQVIKDGYVDGKRFNDACLKSELQQLDHMRDHRMWVENVQKHF